MENRKTPGGQLIQWVHHGIFRFIRSNIQFKRFKFRNLTHGTPSLLADLLIKIYSPALRPVVQGFFYVAFF